MLGSHQCPGQDDANGLFPHVCMAFAWHDNCALMHSCGCTDFGEQEEDVDVMTVQDAPLTQAHDEASSQMVGDTASLQVQELSPTKDPAYSMQVMPQTQTLPATKLVPVRGIRYGILMSRDAVQHRARHRQTSRRR